MTPAAFLGGARAGGGWTFGFGDHLFGAFGGVFGGALAAAVVVAARDAAPHRRPASLDCRFLRAFAAPPARVVTHLLHDGRSMTTVAVDVIDGRDRPTTHATITLVDVEVLHDRTRDDAPLDWARDAAGGAPWHNPAGFEAPIIDTLKPRTVGVDGDTVATAIDIPWDDDGATAEAVCVAADLCVGPPVALAVRGARVAHPNPDLSLRFAGGATAPPGGPVVGAGRLAALAGGLATVAIDVAAGGRLVGVGASFSVLLEPPR